MNTHAYMHAIFLLYHTVNKNVLAISQYKAMTCTTVDFVEQYI